MIDTNDSASRSYRQRAIRFGLRSLLVLVLLLAIPCAWLAQRIRHGGQVNDAVTELEPHGGLLRYDYEFDKTGQVIRGGASPPGPSWIRRVFGENILANEYQLLFAGSIVATDDLVHLTETATDRQWNAGSTLRDEHLTVLEKLPRLKILNFGGNNLTDGCLPHLRKLKSLHTLKIGSTGITDAGLDHVSRLSSVKVLCLNDTRVTDSGIAKVAAMPGLRILNLAMTDITDKVVNPLATMTSLEGISLHGTAVSDNAITTISEMPNVNSLVLRETAVTDNCVDLLKEMEQLNYLDVRGTRISKEGISMLKQNLPKCRIRP